MNHDESNIAPTLVQFQEVTDRERPGESLLSANLDVVRHVQVNVAVVAGRGSLPIGELLALKEGQVLKLEALLDAPMDIVLDGNIVARGDLVAVGEHFGVRIVELAGPQRR
jgi:flagellar motor switch protein FliN/FliY